ncbi:MAG: methyltransferase domain-containing protein, partial [Candidatus Hydrogenedentes bacterium]|nr:methyltransferase domain-containing protein [Candidatus Hydrogenedentota bacterium]
MTRRDDFAGLARYYDQIMDHVDYYRWHSVAMGLAELLPEPVVHLDAACGTGTFADMMRLAGHQSLGVDLSPGMLKVARRKRPLLPVAQADLRHLPFSGSIGLMTCLFDSVNFLLSIDDVRAMFEQCFAAMASPALLYFDVVTERMVLDHFAGQQWEEDNGEFSTRWSSEFEQGESTSQTH